VYGLSRLFLFPSLSEGFGMPVIEAMACGTPVITSKISCMPEIAGDAALLVDPLSPPSIAEALLTLLNNGELMAEKIQDGILNARRFSWTKTAEKVLGVYDKVLHPTPQAKLKRPAFKFILEPNLYFSNRK
jgi:glycosyltransferase involved in cell wall biosynthesis